MIWAGSTKWKLCRQKDCGEPHELTALRDRYAAIQWLRQLKPSFSTASLLREALERQADLPVSRMTDEDVVEQLAFLLEKRIWHVHAWPMIPGGKGKREEADAPEEREESAPVREKKETVNLEFRRVYWDGTPIPNLTYTVVLPDGSNSGGRTDSTGYACHRGVTPGDAMVTYGLDPNPPKCAVTMEVDEDLVKLFGMN